MILARRPTWDDVGMSFASDIAARSVCRMRQVGAAVSSADRRVWAFGYNGMPSGFPTGGAGCDSHCPQAAGGDWCVAVHAEVNCLMQSSRRDREGGTFYSTAAPCLKCALAIANSGVVGLVCPSWEDDRLDIASQALTVLRRCGIHVRHPVKKEIS